jgi:hypothetical protein
MWIDLSTLNVIVDDLGKVLATKDEIREFEGPLEVGRCINTHVYGGGVHF